MSDGRKRATPTPYRDGQNAMRDGATATIVYMPPEYKDVPNLMRHFVAWTRERFDLPCPIIVAIAHYQFATIHPSRW